MMRTIFSRLHALLLLATISATTAYSQILWKVSGNGVHDSYILGTHHIAPVAILDSIAGFDEAFAQCQVLYGEIDMASSMQEIAAKSQQYMLAPADSALSKVLSAEEMKIVDAATQKYMHLPASMFDRLKPAALSTQLAVIQAASIFNGFDPAKQIDAALQQKARDMGMPVMGLETADFQLQMLFGTPVSCQAADLMKMLNDEAGYLEYTRILADVYSRQKIDAMLELMRDPGLGMSEHELDRLIYDRNAAWVEHLKEVLPAEAAFVVVGAGHLPGEKGLLSLLRRAGYSVTPVY